MAVYDENFYLTHYNKNSAKEFLRYTKQLNHLVKTQGWDLEIKYNKHYSGFKAGFFNAFGIQFISTKTFAFFVKISEADAKKTRIPMTRYDDGWKQAVYYIKPGETKVDDFLPVFEVAYRHLTGN